jgi:hypothetical protein
VPTSGQIGSTPVAPVPLPTFVPFKNVYVSKGSFETNEGWVDVVVAGSTGGGVSGSTGAAPGVITAGSGVPGGTTLAIESDTEGGVDDITGAVESLLSYLELGNDDSHSPETLSVKVKCSLLQFKKSKKSATTPSRIIVFIYIKS